MPLIALLCPECGQVVTWETWRNEHPFMTMCCGTIVKLVGVEEGYALTVVDMDRVGSQEISPESHE